MPYSATVLLLFIMPALFFAYSSSFGPKTTAKQIVDNTVGAESLLGKTAIITGSNSGIGLETAKSLVYGGCNVVMAVRDKAKGEAAIAEYIIKAVGASNYAIDEEVAKARIRVEECDLNSLASVKAFADRVKDQEGMSIDYLINNAGIMATPQLEFTEDGLEKQIGVNHFAHAYLTNELYEKLTNQSQCRIINVASTAHFFGKMDYNDINYQKGRMYTPWGSYGQSKLANILFSKGLAQKLQSDGYGNKVSVVSVHPGVIRTNLWRETPIKIPFIGKITDAIGFMDKSIPQGASTTLWCALSDRVTTPEYQGAWCSDCISAKPSDEACSQENIDKLMKVTEDLLSEKTEGSQALQEETKA